jgi:hypothetical protein
MPGRELSTMPLIMTLLQGRHALWPSKVSYACLWSFLFPLLFKPHASVHGHAFTESGAINKLRPVVIVFLLPVIVSGILHTTIRTNASQDDFDCPDVIFTFDVFRGLELVVLRIS